jgi:hypothetical protein
MTPTEYREKSEECRQQAQQARTPHDRTAWLKLAEDWLKLAGDY